LSNKPAAAAAATAAAAAVIWNTVELDGAT
jgi:hypothetical protein